MVQTIQIFTDQQNFQRFSCCCSLNKTKFHFVWGWDSRVYSHESPGGYSTNTTVDSVELKSFIFMKYSGGDSEMVAPHLVILNLSYRLSRIALLCSLQYLYCLYCTLCNYRNLLFYRFAVSCKRLALSPYRPTRNNCVLSESDWMVNCMIATLQTNDERIDYIDLHTRARLRARAPGWSAMTMV